MIIQNAKVFYEGQFQSLDVRMEDGIIKEVASAIHMEEGEDARGRYLVPGFIDLHTHGCMGHDFSNAKADEINEMCRHYINCGVTSVVATTMTMNYETYKETAVRLKEYIESKQNLNLLGLNMEGPFLSEEKKGAHDAQFLLQPEIDKIRELDRLAGGHFLLIDLAPELPDAMDCIREFSGEKVLSLAHTACNYTQAIEAFEAGASQVTHLFNAMNGIHHREAGPIGAAFDRKAGVELICDGIHVNPTVLRMVFAMMPEQIIVISDSISACGLPDGEYVLGGQTVFTKGKKAALLDGTIAGSVTDLEAALGYLVHECGIPLEKVIPCMSEHPAKALGLEQKLGFIQPGRQGDVLLLNEDLTIKKVYKKGIEVK
ncbi:MAG: N-acetylglucosamine-6-phosphate deacetylase [Lachnospiraceae bacterium]